VILPNGNLCHSEGLVRLDGAADNRDPVDIARGSAHRLLMCFRLGGAQEYDVVMAERMPALEAMVENSPLNRWDKGSGASAASSPAASADSVCARGWCSPLGLDVDILSLAFHQPPCRRG
jgi:indolepyruvate ferredoxin oxidoreductase alpha subunit